MKTRGLLLIVCAMTLSSLGLGAVGTWKNFTSMKEVRSLTREGTTYWAATSGGLFGWNSANNSYQRYTNADGLQSTDLTAVGIDRQRNVWAGTSSGLIHVYSQQTGSWRYILDIANANQTNKRVNGFTMLGDTVFVCTEFGLSVFRIGRFEFGDTYNQFGTLQGNARVAVTSAEVYSDSLWLTVSDGNISRIAVASLATLNLLPPESWSLRTVGGATVVLRQVVVFNGKLYSGTNAGLFVYASGIWSPIPSLAGQGIVSANSSTSLLSICTQTAAYTLDRQDVVRQIGGTLPFPALTMTSDVSGQPVIGSGDSAGSGVGLLTYDTTWTSHAPNGPNSNRFSSVAVAPNGTVWGASGSTNGSGIYRYNGRDWKSFSNQNSPVPTNDYYHVSVGCNGSVWASSWGNGILEIPAGSDGADTAHIFGRNIGMVGIPTAPEYIVVSNVVCDGAGNNWMTVIAAADRRIIVVRKANGTWARYPAFPKAGSQFTNFMDNPIDQCLAIDAYGSLWSAVMQDRVPLGVVSFDNRRAVGDTICDYHLTADDGLPSNGVTTIISDLEGQLWIGTDRGIGIITDPANPTRSGGIASYVPLRGTTVNCIAVDALNQKWVGTSEGVVVLSPDGTQQISTYTVASTSGNLIDDNIKSIAIDGQTGTVYFGTLFGLASLTTAAATPKQTFDNLLISPNPFIVPTTTQATIDGLVQNSTIKILSVDGRLVRQLVTPGGRIGFWDGKNEMGEFVASGIYLVVASSDKDEKVAKGKIAVIRR